MAFITYPLNNIDYTAEDAELFHCTRTSGIWAEDSFPIFVTGADNNVTIGTGIAWINNKEFSGKVAALKSAEVLDLGIADGTYPRIDVIAIQYSANNNATDVVIKKGTPATNPVRPAIVRSGAVYELYIASVYRPAGATAITASNITDLRMDTTVCGLMADSVTKIDMDAIRAQLTGLVEELEEAIQNIEVGEIVPIEKGGTGASTVANARSNLGIGNVATENVLPIEKGGTNAITSEAAAKNLGYGKILWTGGSFMNSSHVMTLDEAISEQPHGIVVVFSRYDGGTLDDTFASFFIPKELIELKGNNSHDCIMATGNFKNVTSKILYITDTTITGFATNVQSGTNNGITFNNSNFVMRYIIGV